MAKPEDATPEMQPGRVREPQRAVSREIFSSIIQGAAQLIQNSGRIPSTTRIAERAGVSVGSLYRYFENKWAVVQQVAEEKEKRTLGLARDLRDSTEGLNVDVVRAAVRLALSDVRNHLPARRVFLSQLPRGWVAAAERHTHETIEAFLAKRMVLGGMDEEGAERRAFLMLHAVRGPIQEAVLREPQRLEEPEFEELLVALVQTLITHPVGSEGGE